LSKKLKITLLGATGAVGGIYLTLALGAGHQVLALVRDPAKLDPREGLTVMAGDATQPEDVAAAIANADVVVSCVGGSKGVHIMESTARSVLDAARLLQNPPKSIFISSLGCSGSSWLIKLVSIIIGGRKTFADYDKADILISRENTVPYVLVRPTGFTDNPGTGKYTVFRSGGTFAKLIPRADVAKFLFDATTTNTWDGPGGVQLGGYQEGK
jgi:hypothetical protein